MKLIIFIVLLVTLYYFFCHKPIEELETLVSQVSTKAPPQIYKCDRNSTIEQCEEHKNMCHYNTDGCISQCKRNKCENITDKPSCQFSSNSRSLIKSPPCYWTEDQCKNCPPEYRIFNPETEQITCYKNRCNSLPEDLCKAIPYNETCCWNETKKICECRSKQEDPYTKQCYTPS